MVNLLCSLNADSKLAAMVALIIMGCVIIGCTLWLILKKLHLKKIYHEDEKYVAEYKKKMKEREEKGVLKPEKSDKIGEDL